MAMDSIRQTQPHCTMDFLRGGRGTAALDVSSDIGKPSFMAVVFAKEEGFMRYFKR